MSLSIVEYFAEHSGYKCGYCGQDDTNFSHGMWAHTLTTQDYQDLIDRGWRRSGQYCYKPTMNKTCCPLYTIKCEALKFKPSKSQKKVIKRFVNYILHDVHSGNKKDATDDDNDEEESLVCSETVNQKNEEMEGKVQLKNVEQLEISEKNDEISSPAVTAALPSSTVEPTANDCDNQNLEKKGKHPIGMDPSKPKQGKAKIRRLEKWKAKHGDADEKLIKSKNQEKSVEDLLLPLENAKDLKHKWEIRLVHAHDSDKVFSSTLKETVSVYQKYQQVIHNDSPDKCTEKQFKRFLCNSPLQPGDSGPPHGSYHYQYCIDGEIFAVGVLDILPHCVSSVYLYYDPKYSFLSPGTLTSLLEIALVRKLSSSYPAITNYYLGFYIHSCVKMKYKGRYSPSLLLCPETYNWRPLPDCLPLLDSAPYSRLETDPGKTDKDSSIELSRVGVLYCRQATNYQNYQRLVEQEQDDSDSDAVDDKEEVLEYAGLVGNTIAKRMLLYRTG